MCHYVTDLHCKPFLLFLHLLELGIIDLELLWALEVLKSEMATPSDLKPLSHTVGMQIQLMACLDTCSDNQPFWTASQHFIPFHHHWHQQERQSKMWMSLVTGYHNATFCERGLGQLSFGFWGLHRKVARTFYLHIWRTNNDSIDVLYINLILKFRSFKRVLFLSKILACGIIET